MIKDTRRRIIAAYAAAWIALFVLFLAVLAPPGTPLQSRVEAWARERGIGLAFDGFVSSLPTGFDFRELKLTPPGSTGKYYTITEGSFRVSPWEMLKTRLGMVFSGTLSEGRIQARVLSAPWISFGSLQSEVTVERIVLKESPLISRLAPKAMLDGVIVFNHSGDTSSGTLALHSVSLVPAGHGDAGVFLRNIDAELPYEFKDGTIVLGKSRFKGDGLEGTLNGTIRLGPTPGRSVLDLSIEARLDATRVAPKFASFIPKGVPWRLAVTGELQNPSYALR
jgi:type II secretion system protein N